MRRETPTEQAMRDSCLFSAERALQLVDREARKTVKSINERISDAKSNAGELRVQMNRVHACKQMSMDSRDDELAAECFTEEIIEIGSSSILEAVLYREKVLAVLWTQMAVKS